MVAPARSGKVGGRGMGVAGRGVVAPPCRRHSAQGTRATTDGAWHRPRLRHAACGGLPPDAGGGAHATPRGRKDGEGGGGFGGRRGELPPLRAARYMGAGAGAAPRPAAAAATAARVGDGTVSASTAHAPRGAVMMRCRIGCCGWWWGGAEGPGRTEQRRVARRPPHTTGAMEGAGDGVCGGRCVWVVAVKAQRQRGRGTLPPRLYQMHVSTPGPGQRGSARGRGRVGGGSA